MRGRVAFATAGESAPLQILSMAAMIAREGSSGVENTLSMRTRPASTHTQSVNVPPVSTATRNSVVFFGDPGMLAQQAIGDSHHAGNDTESRKHIGRGFHKGRRVANTVGMSGEFAEKLLRDKSIGHHGKNDAGDKHRNAEKSLRKSRRDGDRHYGDKAAGATQREENAEGCGNTAAMNMLGSLMLMFVVPGLGFFRDHVDVQVFMRMVMMNVQVLVHLDLA